MLNYWYYIYNDCFIIFIYLSITKWQLEQIVNRVIHNILILGSATDEGTKDSKLDKVFWFKVAFSVIMGIAFGAFNLTGFLSFVM